MRLLESLADASSGSSSDIPDFSATDVRVVVGSGASGHCFERRGVLIVSREQGDREVGAFGNGDDLRRVSRRCYARRHDDRKPLDAQGKNLFCVP